MKINSQRQKLHATVIFWHVEGQDSVTEDGSHQHQLITEKERISHEADQRMAQSAQREN